MNQTDTDILNIFAMNVRKKRQELGLSQEKLAELANLHRTYIGMIERSEKNITLRNIQKIANALGVTPASLLKTNNKPS